VAAKLQGNQAFKMAPRKRKIEEVNVDENNPKKTAGKKSKKV
jgi:hypothetical protein